MGLLIKFSNGDTALKSLKYGNDRPGGGSSNQPYIKAPIAQVPEFLSSLNTDFILRGGFQAPISAAEDVIRITKYMFDFKSPSGLLFIAKQNLLSRVAVPNEAAQKWGINGPGAGYAGGALNEGVYTPLSTIAQAGVGYFGFHLNKQGIDPTETFPNFSIKRYEDVVKDKNRAEFNKIDVNFPIGLLNNVAQISNVSNFVSGLTPFAQQAYVDPFPPITPLDVATQDVNTNAVLFNRLLDLWYYKNFQVNPDTSILSYGGGPGSILGIGKTIIPFAENQRTGVNNPLFSTNKQFFLEGGKPSPSQYIEVDKNGNYILTDTLNYTKLLGASVEEGLSFFETGINESGQITTLYSPEVPYATLSKYNPTGQSLTGSSEPIISRTLLTNVPIVPGYQIGSNLKYQTQESDVVDNFPINRIMGYYERQLVAPLKFTPGNTWSNTSVLGGTPSEYNSDNTLRRDYFQSASSTTALWPDFNKFYGFKKGDTKHTNGYLADLDKNAGYYFDANTNQPVFFNNGYPGGIAPDFRLVPRTKRGLAPLPESAQNEDVGGLGETSTIYIGENKRLEKTTLDRIYYKGSSHKSSFRTPTNPFSSDSNDLIDFKFEVVDPENPSSNPKVLKFRAYIDEFSDGYTADWKGQTYMGRAEQFYKYNSFKRDISLGFTVVAESKELLAPMYQNLNILAASLSPTYTKQGYMAGNLHRVTVGNYINREYGVITGMSFQITEDSPWNIKSAGRQLPRYIQVSGIKFTPIQRFRPEYEGASSSNYINQG